MNKKIFILICTILAAGLLAACGPATPTPEPLSVDVGTAGAPKLAAQSPIPGQQLDLGPVIELTFDRPMDPASVEAAWAMTDPDGNPVPGSVSWSDTQTFQFTPSDSLIPDAEYAASLSASASAEDGTPLAEALTFSFHTVTALSVSETFPADQSYDLDVYNSITVVFNRPVVPLTAIEDQSSLPQPLEFYPAVTGTGEWVNSSMYIFQPDTALASGIWYTVTIRGTLADVSGNQMGADHTWYFQTRNVSGYVDDYQLTGLAPNSSLHILFNQPMDTASTQAATSVVDRETGASIPLKYAWYDDNTYLSISPEGRYQLDSFYTLQVDTTARAASGEALAAYIIQEFSTQPNPRIDSVSPANGSQAEDFTPWFTLFFASNMDIDTLNERVVVTPQPGHALQFTYQSFDRSLNVYGLAPATDYVVRILPGMADTYGNTIQSEYSFSFRTGDMPPYAQLLNSYYPLVYRADEAQGMFLEYINIESASVRLYRVSFDEFAPYMQPDNESDPANFAPASAPLQQWDFSPSVQSNRLVRTFLDFGEGTTPRLAPGYYFIGLQAEPFDYATTNLEGAFFMVSADNLSLKSSPDEALAWLTDLETGAPTPGVPVIFYDESMTEIGRAATNADGLAYLDGLENTWFARTDDDAHTAFISHDWGSGVTTGQYGMWWNYYREYSTRFGYVYTDKPIYRPGQEVYFNAIVRRNDDLHYSLPFQPDVYVKITHYGEEVYSGSYTLSEQGSFSGSFQLDSDADLGSYTIELYSSAYASYDFGQVSFRVAEYKKPEFQLTAAPSANEVLVGDQYSIELDAGYYSGGNVGDAEVYWYLESSPYYFNASEDYSQFSFSNWDRDEYWSDPDLQTPSITDEGYAVTDESGHASIPVTAALGKSNKSRLVQIYADVTDRSGNVVGVNTSVIVHQSEWYAGIRSAEYIGTAGEETNFQMVVLDWESNPVPGQAIQVEIVRREWYSVQEQDENGTVRWVTTVEDVPVTSQSLVTGADGLADISFTPETGGIYKALVTVQDPQGRTHTASTYLWVSGGDYVAWRQTNDRSFTIVADQESYTPGDTAKLLIAQPFEGASYALVTVERGHIYSREVIRLTSNSTVYELPISAEMAPAMYVSVLVMDGAQGGDKPDFKMGILRLDVDTSQQTLNVSITTDRSSAGPGDEVTYTVHTTDANGNPVQADVSLALVDKALLALAPPNSGPILGAFYPVRALNVVTSVGIVMNADEFNANYEETAPEGESSGGGGGKGAGDEGILDVREDFRDTALFQAQIVTDANGEASVTVTLPENLTTWVMDARAATADARVGQATHELLSTKPMFVNLQTPRFFTAGDGAVIGATVFNNSNAALRVDVTLEAEGLDLRSAPTQSVDVPAGGQTYLTWETSVTAAATRADLLVRAVSGEYTDTSVPPLGTLDNHGLPVYRFTVRETVGTAGILTGEGSVTEAIQLPAYAANAETTLTVNLSPTLATSLESGITFLEDYPYNCMEQTASRLVANVLNLRILQASGAEDESLRAAIDSHVNAALQRIYANQNYDGGWGWWPGESHNLTSAYVLYALLEARDAGFPVSENVVAYATDYLLYYVPETGDAMQPWEYNFHAFTAYVLVRAGQPQASRLEMLYDQRERLSLAGQAFLTRALALQNPDDARIQTLLADLVSAASVSASGAHWEESETDAYNWGSDLRTTAIVLDTFVDLDPGSPVTVNAVRWLVSNRSTAQWASTQQTVWTLTALSDWLIASSEFEAEYRYAVGVNGGLLTDGAVDETNRSENVSLQLDAAQTLTEGLNYLVLTRSAGTGNLYYSAFLRTNPPVAEVSAFENGVSVSRQYFSLTDDKHPITEIARGEVVRVRVTITAPAALHYLIVNDPLPAGLEAVDSSLLTDVYVPSQYTYSDYFTRGWGWWWFDHTQLRDEAVVLSADYLPAGTYVYTYLARASTAGTFNVIPTTAEEFYFPDVYGRGEGSVFTVLP